MTKQPSAGTVGVVPQWTFADRLRKVRTQAGQQQRAFAETLEVPYPRYAQWEAGNSKPRDIVAVARRIELLTGVPASWTLGVHDNGPRPTESDEGRDLVRRPGLEPGTHWFCASTRTGTVTPLRRRDVERRAPGRRELAPAAAA